MSDYSSSELADIPGIILSGYGHLPHGVYLFIEIRDPVLGRGWLRQVIGPTVGGETELRVASAKRWDPGDKPQTAISVAFTFRGLKAIGLSPQALDTFPTAFTEGMPSRAEILGDTGSSAPENWHVGGRDRDSLHALVMILGASPETLEAALAEQRAVLEASSGGVAELALERGHRPESGKEHFGFLDGLSQPKIEGLPWMSARAPNAVEVGAFILGYKGEYGCPPPSPAVPADQDPEGCLPPFPDLPAYRDLGHHGTYLVYRKLAQDVAGFWQFIERQTSGGAEERQREMRWIGAKMVGRWPSGAPLVLAPERDEPDLAHKNRFGYKTEDEDGRRCPLGAHIRRSNPRDSRFLEDAAEAIKSSNRHRIIRRGMPYGEPLFGSERLAGESAPMGLEDDGRERGLHFFSLQADIATQFEFVQRTWCNNRKFDGLFNDSDPVSGESDGDSHMTIPGDYVRRHILGIPRFVTVRGGAYFFLPSLKALRYLASLG